MKTLLAVVDENAKTANEYSPAIEKVTLMAFEIKGWKKRVIQSSEDRSGRGTNMT